jgi:hypothetical protein
MFTNMSGAFSPFERAVVTAFQRRCSTLSEDHDSVKARMIFERWPELIEHASELI